MEAYSLYEVNEYIKRVIALNFDDAVWIECEINQISNSRGNLYLDLIEKDDATNNIIAKSPGTIWYKQYLFIKKKLAKLTESILAAGVKVKLKVNVNYSERYGLSLNIIDIDPAFTFGQFELQRQQIIDKLREKNLLDKNAAISLPNVIQNVAVISSETAAGYKDFMAHIQENVYGYDFQIRLYQAAMQGQNTEKEVTAAIAQARKDGNDIIAIIRGGGSKLDLASFDNYNIAFEVAVSDTPIITGIGHEIDQTVTDIVANKVLKTPTAVAEFIIEHNAQFEGELLYLLDIIKKEARILIEERKERIIGYQELIKLVPTNLLQLKYQMLDNFQNQLIINSRNKLSQIDNNLNNIESVLELLHPKNVLSRGYALVKQKDKYKTRKQNLSDADPHLEIEFYDGSISVKKSE